VADVDLPAGEEGSSEAEASRAVDAVRLLAAVLEDSPHNRASMAHISGGCLSLWSSASCTPLLLLSARLADSGSCREVED
jgi:hypothetical protein